MRWEERLAGLFEDLEQQAEGLHLADRDAEVAERGRGEYAAHVDLASRIHASVGWRVALSVVGVGPVEGTVGSAGVDWLLLETEQGQEWLLRLAAIGLARGLSERALSELARPVVARLSFGSSLRKIAEARASTLVHHLDGRQSRGWIARVGADFFELVLDEGPGDAAGGQVGNRQPVLVPFASVAGVRPT